MGATNYHTASKSIGSLAADTYMPSKRLQCFKQ